ncbi:T9SS type A sorting domain-containing protein [candidate division KSB1 bacterium]|nr:T9SS type A sorting domain-containing protein [candidate division KSB1 bacterium]
MNDSPQNKKIVKSSILFFLLLGLFSNNTAQTPNFLLTDDTNQTVMKEKATLAEEDWHKIDEGDLWLGGRIGHDMAYLDDDKVLLFGGMEQGRLNDSYIFDLSAHTWSWIGPTDMVDPRQGHAMAHIDGNKVLLFGGQRQYATWLNDTWIYASTGGWTQKSPATSPSNRGAHAMAYIGDDKVLLFGGIIKTPSLDYCNETWIYDLSENNWTLKNPANKPPKRGSHSIAYIGEDKVLLFGGILVPETQNYANDTWVYDLSDNNWFQKNPPKKPNVRQSHDMAYIGAGQVVLYGGSAQGNPVPIPLNDTWIYNLNENTWTEDINSSTPGKRSSHRLSETSMNGSSTPILFGGWRADNNGDLKLNVETWTFGGGDYLKNEYSEPTYIRALNGYASSIPFAWRRPDLPPASNLELDAVSLHANTNTYLLEDVLFNSDKNSAIHMNTDQNGKLIPANAPTGYNVYRSTSTGGTYTKIASNINRQYYRDDNVTAGTTYYYKITAVYTGGESILSDDVSSTTTANGYVINSGAASSVPNLDGVIKANEWADASQTKITHPAKSGDVFLYVMNNKKKLFVAVDDLLDTKLDNRDQFALFFDQDKNREFPATTPSNEGNFWIAWDAPSNSSFTLFGPRSGYWPDHLWWEERITPAGVEHNMSIQSHHVQYEGSIDLNTFPLNLSPNDVIGILVFTYDYNTSSFNGFWPQQSDQLKNIGAEHPQTPFSYGDLKLAQVSDPVLSVDPTVLNFGSTSTSLTFQISNSGGGSLSWNVVESPNKTWVTSVSPSSGTNNGTVTVQVDRSSLASGSSDTGTLSVTSNGGNQSVTVNISKIANPVLSVTPTVLNFGTTTTSLTFQINNGGSGTLNWNAAETPNRPWITSVSPSSGTNNATVTVQVDRSTLAGSNGTGTLSVTSNGGNQNVTVNVSKEANPALSVSRTIMNFGLKATSLTFDISNSGDGILSWSITENPDKPWITSISPSSGTNNATITVQVNRNSLSGTSDSGKLSVTSNGGNQDITVRISTEEIPVLSLNRTVLNFGTTINSRTFQVSNNGSGTLSWNVAENPNKAWITSVSPSSGTNDATVTVQVNRSSLSSGSSDTGTLSVTSNGGNENIAVNISKAADTDIDYSSVKPLEFKLDQNYPNPFNTETKIAFDIKIQTHVILKIVDIKGQHIKTLVDQNQPEGKYTVTWNASGFPSGIYLCRLQAGEYIETKKLILQK